jgi:lysine 6-dehydrogenase
MLTLAAADARCHMVDLGGNVAVVRSQLKLGSRVRRAGVTVIPDCGLAPGMTNILTAWAAAGFERLDRIAIRVGGVPLEPEPPLNYMLLFAPEGLFNEYVEDGLALRGGRVVRLPSLADVEKIRFPEPFGVMEAFSTSGGSSTLVETFRKKARELDYKTVRYPGHCAVMQGMKQAGLMSREPVAAGRAGAVVPREFAGALFEKHLAFRGGDAALVRVTVEGRRGGRAARRVVSLVDRMDGRTGLTAMMRCTAFPAACIVKMLADGVVTERGVHCQEKVVPAAAFVSAMRAAGLAIKLRTSVR